LSKLSDAEKTWLEAKPAWVTLRKDRIGGENGQSAS